MTISQNNIDKLEQLKWLVEHTQKAIPEYEATVASTKPGTRAHKQAVEQLEYAKQSYGFSQRSLARFEKEIQQTV